jgi:NifU-like protein
MWKYSKTLMDHFMNPRNSGQLPDPDGHSEVGSPQCGDAMTLDIMVDDEDRISEIRFMTFGCAGAIAAASALTEIAKGTTLDDALSITNDQIVEYLGGMPEEKYHCSVMGHEALEEAISDFRQRRKRIEERLRGIIDDPPEQLGSLLEKGELRVRGIHPSRVTVSYSGNDGRKVVELLEDELGRRTGRDVEVSMTE